MQRAEFILKEKKYIRGMCALVRLKSPDKVTSFKVKLRNVKPVWANALGVNGNSLFHLNTVEILGYRLLLNLNHSLCHFKEMGPFQSVSAFCFFLERVVSTLPVGSTICIKAECAFERHYKYLLNAELDICLDEQ